VHTHKHKNTDPDYGDIRNAENQILQNKMIALNTCREFTISFKSSSQAVQMPYPLSITGQINDLRSLLRFVYQLSLGMIANYGCNSKHWGKHIILR
jgi:hypothetical protein